jgi:hypothetical protein
MVIWSWGFWTGSLSSEKNRNEQEVAKVPGHGYAAKMSSIRTIHVPTGRFLLAAVSTCASSSHALPFILVQ